MQDREGCNASSASSNLSAQVDATLHIVLVAACFVEVHRAISHQFNMIVASHSLLREQYATDCCTRRTAVDLVTGRLPAQSQTRPDATTAWRPSSVLYQVRAYCSTANNPRGTSRSMRVLCCLSQDDLFRVPSPLQYYPTQRALSRRISFTHLSSAW